VECGGIVLAIIPSDLGRTGRGAGNSQGIRGSHNPCGSGVAAMIAPPKRTGKLRKQERVLIDAKSEELPGFLMSLVTKTATFVTLPQIDERIS
jgi:hypothetical protein